MTRLTEIIAARTQERRHRAERCATRILDRLGALDLDAAVIGSLVTGRFGLHSDIDILVRSPVDPAGRAAVERTVAGILRGSGIPYDLVFACDLTPAQREAFEHDLVIASGLREARAEA